MKLLSRQSRALPGVTGVARVSRRSETLLGRVGHRDIVVIDHVDIDRATADALVKAGVTAVVNAAPSISGRYPNLGPEILVSSGVLLVDGVGEKVFGRLKDGAKVRLDGGTLYAGEEVVAEGIEQTQESVADLMIEAKSGMSSQLEAFAANAIEYMKRERTLLLDGVGIPEVDHRDRRPSGAAGRAVGGHQGATQVAEEVHRRFPSRAGRGRRRRRRAARRRVHPGPDHRESGVDRLGDAALRRRGRHSGARRRPRPRAGAAAGPRRRRGDVPRDGARPRTSRCCSSTPARRR